MLTSLNPLIKLAVCLVWMVACIAVFDLRLQLAAIVIVVLALIFLQGVRPLVVLALMVPFALFGFGFLTTNLLFRQEAEFATRMAGQALFASPAFSAGFTLFLRAIAIGLISAFFALTTDPGAFVRALMAYCRLSPRFGYALFSVLQFVPDLAAEARQIRIARAMKQGRPPRRFVGPVEAAGLLVPLLAFAIRRAGRAAIAMEARGLARGRARTLTHVPAFGRGDTAFALAASLVLALLVGMLVRYPV